MVRVRDRERTMVRVRVLGCGVEHGLKVYGYGSGGWEVRERG